MKIMADLDAVHLGLDENEADIAEELQDFDDSFDTRSEASESGSETTDSQPSISSVSSVTSSVTAKRKTKMSKKKEKDIEKPAPTPTTKRAVSPSLLSASALNGKSPTKKKKSDANANFTPKPEDSTADSKKASSGINAVKKSRKKSTNTNTANNNNTVPNNNTTCEVKAPTNISSSVKSEASDAEEKSAAKGQFESDSESEDSDSAANIKRNGRKAAASKSASPEKKSSTGNPSKNSAHKSYDYMTKLNYLFRDTRFFLIKSNNADNITLSKNKNVWATLPQNDANLNQAFKEARNILLIFSVNESGKFAGFARMSAPSRRDIPQVAWILPPSISAKALGGVIEIDWICRKELSFNCTSHLYNSWNEGKPVKIGRDGQEIEPKVAAELCRLFPEDEKVELTPILRKSKESAKLMREKGIRVVYKAPRSLSSRGGRGPSGGSGSYRHGGDRRGGDGNGPMRHKRSYSGIGQHRVPYKPMGPPPGMSYKRSSSPYRGGPGGLGGPGGSRSGGGDSGLPPWERYMTSAAAAEAYVADYMRTMHGQLPPLPFVPPFAQVPLPGSGSGGGSIAPSGGPPSLYEQLPPPVRYYDGPPLPDYPPPQPIRPPPPGFDKPPSYEDFAAWKNAGLPTVPGPVPPGFPAFGNSSAANGSGPAGSSGSGNFSSSGGNSSAGGSASGSGPNSYRSSNRSDNNMNRARERGASGRDYHHRGGPAGGSSRSGGERDRYFRATGNGGGPQHRQYRDSRR